MSNAHSLYRLQRIDLALDKNNARLEEIHSILENSEELRKARNALTHAEDHLREQQSALKSAEHAVEIQRSKLEETESTLYSGTITNPKELQDLQMEAESLKRFLSTLEDRLLDAMMDLEQAENDVENTQSILEDTERLRNIEHQQLHQEQEQLTEDNDRLDGDREAALASVSIDDLTLYESLRERHGGAIVALLEEDGSCSMCGLSIAASLRQKIRSGKQIVQCNQCKRILYAG
jgi:predicted  nucleic acid-binding Zn-ribbon protein